LLQTLAVLGREYSLSLIRGMVAQSDDQLRRLLGHLQLSEFIFERPYVGDTEYIFKHALTQEVAYNALLLERRKVLHERAGIALESILADQLEDHLDELAHHYGRSDNLNKAVEYLGRAGQQALQRSAYAAAIDRLTTAIDLLQKLADGPERVQRELVLQLGVGLAYAIKSGWVGLEVERAYSRALELCEQLGDPAEVFPALQGLWAVHALREELAQAFPIAERLLRIAQVSGDRVLLMYAQYALGFTSFWKGEFFTARKHLETVIVGYDPQLDRRLAFLYG
jgi:predicted ATPase